MNLTKSLAKFSPCEEATKWLKAGNFRSRQAAWDACKRGDWMLWLLGKLSGPPESKGRKKLVLAACGCARLALKYVKSGENSPRVCIETAEAWSNGQATIEQVRDARSAAAAAYAYAYAAAAAAAAAAYAAHAADDADDAAAHAAAYAADAADAADDARSKMLAQCADVVRKHYPKAPRV